jgi:O-antigen/teichoic acid export membrane protein
MAMITIIGTTFLFLSFALIFSRDIARWIDYSAHSEYIRWFAWILALDALAAVPFALLRSQNRPGRFALIRMINIGVNIGLNLFFLLLCPYLIAHYPEGFAGKIIVAFYNQSWGIEYIFISNLIASAATIIMLLPQISGLSWRIDRALWKKMLIFTFPLLFAGMAGIVNETFDRLLLRYLLPKDISTYQVGVYAACYKISILMTIFIQAYKYAAEPFFFAQAKEKNAKEVYARIMNYFVIIVTLIFLATMLFLDDFILPLLVRNKEYWAGKAVIPVLLMANLFLGIYYNLSIWYKLTGKTSWGAWISITGAVITLVLNFWWIPLGPESLIHGYYGSAWATFICYGSMMILSYLLGQKFFPVKYNLTKFAGYLGLSIVLYAASLIIKPEIEVLRIAYHALLLLIFCGVVLLAEKPQLKAMLN